MNEAAQPMFSTHGLPVDAQVDPGPVIPVEKWKITNGFLTKLYSFRELEQKNMFIRFLLTYEEEVQHNARLTIDELTVKIELLTKGVDQVTEIDKEYARFADLNFKDVVYNSPHGG
jgi:pterin-4a-carbinolamine dehydratase